MTTIEILSAFMKGYEKVSISEKQKNWLLSQAKKEGIKVNSGGFDSTIYFEDCHYTIKNCKALASGGSYVGSRIIQGRYNIEKMYYVRFTDTGYKFVCCNTDLNHYKREGYSFDIIGLKNYL